MRKVEEAPKLKTGTREGITAFVITAGGALVTLWQGIDTFSAVAGPAYATAILTGLIAAFQARHARLNNKP